VNAYTLPVRRPVATSMFFLALLLLGLLAWVRIPVELLPPVSGDSLYVSFARPGSDPEVVEREILLPLESATAALSGVEETWAELRGPAGTFQVRFAMGTDLKVREIELRRLAGEIARDQPRGTAIDVESQDTSAIGRFVMFVQVTGQEDQATLLDFVEQRLVPRLAAVPGAARVLAGGAGSREIGVRIDPARCAILGVKPEQVVQALERAVRRVTFVGGAEDERGRSAVMLEGRPRGTHALGEVLIDAARGVRLRHVAQIERGTGRQEMLFRVNGRPTVALVVFQEEGANLVRLGADLRRRLDELRGEFGRYGVDFVVHTDASLIVEEQLRRLEQLAASGFGIALVVLYLFLRRWRAVAVVAVAVPASLLTALALLYVQGHSLNLITLFGLAVGTGMLVDNSIVVYEAVQRQLERGATPDEAAERGVRRTLRPILASCATNSIVFLPIAFVDFDDGATRTVLAIMALAILLPMFASVLVAVGLVPLLARRLTAPAAAAHLADLRRRQAQSGGLLRPERAKALFTGVLAGALRRPAAWVTAVVAAVLITAIVAVPWVAFSGLNREPPQADTVRLALDVDAGGSLERAAGAFERVELAVLATPGVEFVQSVIREDGGSFEARLVPAERRPAEATAGKIREVALGAAKGAGMRLRAGESPFGGGGDRGGGMNALLGQAPAATVVSGPDARDLDRLARDIEEQLAGISWVETASVEGRAGDPELRVLPDGTALAGYGLTADEVLPALLVVRREGVTLRTGLIEADGREIPLTVRREEDAGQRARSIEELRQLPLSTASGVLPLSALADVRRMPAAPPIRHHDGRREVRVTHRLSEDAPATGPARQALEAQIRQAIQQVYRPPGYIIDTAAAEDSFDWFKRVLIPVVLLLFAVLAFAFESLTLPLLVLTALPLTLLGATWSLALSGMPADYMALVGCLMLIGVTVNPAILLVDRMQQRAWRGGMSAGAAALAAVRERARPVLMTMTTAVAGLWPMAIPTGRENEIWPPFATVLMGGLVSSTLLTLLFIPVGFVFLHRLDRLFGRMGPWVLLGWWAATAGTVAPLFVWGVVTSLTWQILTTLLLAAVLLGVAVWIFRRPEFPQPAAEAGPPAVEVRCLHKVYGRPGPVGRAWRVHERFAATVRRLGGRVTDRRQAGGQVVATLLVFAGALYLAGAIRGAFWSTVFALTAAGLVASALHQVRGLRGHRDDLGRERRGGVEAVLAALAPWAAYVWIVLQHHRIDRLAGQAPGVRSWILAALGVGLIVFQLGRRTARRVAAGQLAVRPSGGRLVRVRATWRRFSRACFGLDLPREEVRALCGVNLRAERGMVGILGPNGAGKTTLLRLLAGILDPSTGVVALGGVPIHRLRRYLARWVGYLPQDFGLPRDLTAREYLDYWALLYEIGPAAERHARVTRLLEEVGLGARADEKIGSYSGGMRQRVAVARTLLRLPAVIIVDEPTVGLDPRERIRFRNLLSRLAEGRVVLFSTHVVEDVEVACERVVVMARGRVAFDGAPDGLADVAEGKVWSLLVEPGQTPDLPRGSLVVEQVPEPSGAVRTRVLSSEAPGDAAHAERPTLQDGYLWLVGEHRAAA